MDNEMNQILEKLAKGEIILIIGKNGAMLFCSPNNLSKIKELMQ